MARRFIVKEENIKKLSDDLVQIFGEEVKHIQVLRKDAGDKITVNDGVYEIFEMKRDSVVLRFVENAPVIGVPDINVTLYIAVLKTDKLDFVVQKAVEIGVKEIVPFFSTNVVVKLDEKDREKRQNKLQKIADEACKQCGRTDSVKVKNFTSFKELEKVISKNDIVLFAYEASKGSLRKEIEKIKENNFKNIGIVIGAEGGFTPSEAQKLQGIENVKQVSLGSRILRAETAALNLLSIVIYEMEE